MPTSTTNQTACSRVGFMQHPDSHQNRLERDVVSLCVQDQCWRFWKTQSSTKRMFPDWRINFSLKRAPLSQLWACYAHVCKSSADYDCVLGGEDSSSWHIFKVAVMLNHDWVSTRTEREREALKLFSWKYSLSENCDCVIEVFPLEVFSSFALSVCCFSTAWRNYCEGIEFDKASLEYILTSSSANTDEHFLLCITGNINQCQCDWY